MNGDLTPAEVADMLGVTPATLANHRSQGNGPPYRKIGRTISYPSDGVKDWCDRQIVEPTPKVTVTYRTIVLDVPTTILGLLPGVLILEHWCNLCRRQVDTDLLVDHARGHYDAHEAGL